MCIRDSTYLPIDKRNGGELRVLLPLRDAVLFPRPFRTLRLGYGYPNRAEINLEIARLRREIRRSQIQQNTNNARQEQAVALQQQAFKDQRARGRQACFDRSTGGFEICADLFAGQKDELKRCDALVIQRNPSCNDVPLKGSSQLPSQASDLVADP